jgi:hypothetical protein
MFEVRRRLPNPLLKSSVVATEVVSTSAGDWHLACMALVITSTRVPRLFSLWCLVIVKTLASTSRRRPEAIRLRLVCVCVKRAVRNPQDLQSGSKSDGSCDFGGAGQELQVET